MHVHYVPACDLRIGDLVIPDQGLPRQVTAHRLEGTPARAVVQYAGIPGRSTCYPATLRILIRSDPPPNTGPRCTQ